MSVSDEEKATLTKLLGQDAFVTPAAMANGLGWLLSKFKEQANDLNSEIQSSKIAPQYANQTDLAKMFGLDTTTCKRFLEPLIRAKKIKVWHPEESKGHPRYCVADFERAYLKDLSSK